LNESNLVYNYSKVQPTPDSQVYVMRWFDSEINETGKVNQVTINIRTW